MGDSDLAFARNVCDIFGLGSDGVQVASLPGSANRLWALQAASGRFVVKEFPYDDEDEQKTRGKSLVKAAEFEYGIWRTGQLAMPEPVRSVDGQLIRVLTGSRGLGVAVRVHRHIDGARVTIPPSTRMAEAAGVALAIIQRFGRTVETRPSGSLRWWTVAPGTVLRRLSDAGSLAQDQAELAHTALQAADAVIAAGDELAGRWVFTHCDHKPENSLLVDGQVAVLDWDESGLCHPRLEAVEAALRWAGVGQGEPSRDAFCAFLAAYERRCGQVQPLHQADFAKRVAALAGWFSFTGRRALGDFDDTDAEVSAAASMAVAAVSALHATLASLDHWVTWLAAP